MKFDQKKFDDLLEKYKSGTFDEKEEKKIIQQLEFICDPDDTDDNGIPLMKIPFTKEDYEKNVLICWKDNKYENLKRGYKTFEIKDIIKEWIKKSWSITTNGLYEGSIDEVLFNRFNEAKSRKCIINNDIIQERLTTHNTIFRWFCNREIDHCNIYFWGIYINITMDKNGIFCINGFKSIYYENSRK